MTRDEFSCLFTGGIASPRDVLACYAGPALFYPRVNSVDECFGQANTAAVFATGVVWTDVTLTCDFGWCLQTGVMFLAGRACVVCVTSFVVVNPVVFASPFIPDVLYRTPFGPSTRGVLLFGNEVAVVDIAFL